MKKNIIISYSVCGMGLRLPDRWMKKHFEGLLLHNQKLVSFFGTGFKTWPFICLALSITCNRCAIPPVTLMFLYEDISSSMKLDLKADFRG